MPNQGFQKDAKWMYTGSEDGAIKIWDLRAPSCQRNYDVGSAVTTVALHPNQAELISGDIDGKIKVRYVSSVERFPWDGDFFIFFFLPRTLNANSKVDVIERQGDVFVYGLLEWLKLRNCAIARLDGLVSPSQISFFQSDAVP